MPNIKAIAEEAKEIMKQGAVIITAAEYRKNSVSRLQLYFWDEREAVMDIISKDDLLEGWPDDGVYVLNPAAPEPFAQVRRFEGSEEVHLRLETAADEEKDDLGPLPEVRFLEAGEAICALRDKTKI